MPVAVGVSPTVVASIGRSTGRWFRAARSTVSLSAPPQLLFLKAGISGSRAERLPSRAAAVLLLTQRPWALSSCKRTRSVHGNEGQVRGGTVPSLAPRLLPTVPSPFRGGLPCKPGPCCLGALLGGLYSAPHRDTRFSGGLQAPPSTSHSSLPLLEPSVVPHWPAARAEKSRASSWWCLPATLEGGSPRSERQTASSHLSSLSFQTACFRSLWYCALPIETQFS